ncbi:Uncharacterised protein [Mycobacteroides abscessus]|nr:Uncharacterised protein [Mycobacteroides abscessus]
MFTIRYSPPFSKSERSTSSGSPLGCCAPCGAFWVTLVGRAPAMMGSVGTPSSPSP